MWGPIKEARKLIFKEEIGSCMIHVELNEVGWIHVEQYKGKGGLFGHTNKFSKINLTTEDARNLIKCLQQFVPKQDGEKQQGE